MNRSSDRVELVRMFPDYAESVLWFPHPLSYEQTGLSDALIVDLKAWDRRYYEGLSDYEWPSDELAQQFTDDGRRLAHRVSDELGDGFAVESHSYTRRGRSRTYRSQDDGRNPAAVAVFRALAESEQAARAELEEVRRSAAKSGHELGWYAYAPGDQRE